MNVFVTHQHVKPVLLQGLFAKNARIHIICNQNLMHVKHAAQIASNVTKMILPNVPYVNHYTIQMMEHVHCAQSPNHQIQTVMIAQQV